MPKRKEKHETKFTTTSEWLRESRRTHDSNILRKLISDSSEWKSETQRLDKILFEKSFNLGAVPKAAVSIEVLNRALGQESEKEKISISMSKRKPQGENLISQIISMLPNNVTEREIESITYALSRIVTERVPKDTRWPIVPPGLDSLSAALLKLYLISNSVRQRIPWMITIWNLKIKDAKIDALESIEKSLKENADVDSIKQALRDADTSINTALGRDSRIDTQDPLSRQISEWIVTLPAKDSELKKKKSELRKDVRDHIADLRGYSKKSERETYVQSAPLTHWNIQALRSDGPAAHIHEPLLRLIRQEINILGYKPIRDMCINLKLIENPGRPSVRDLQEVADYKGRSAYYETHRLESLLTETYIPTLRKIGLRYRYIFTPRQRPGVLSDGLIERYVMIEDNIRGCTVHLEPNLSKGPDARQFPEGSVEAVVEDEIVTLNLNHFDQEKGDWISLKQGDSTITKQRDDLILQRSTLSEDKQPFVVSARQAELLGLLWSLQGPRTQRRWLLNTVNYSEQIATRTLKQLRDTKVVRLLYLPALEFCRLPDGLVVYANCSDRKSRERFVDHIIKSQPFSKILIGDSNDVVAHIRGPLKTSDTVAGNLRDNLPQFADIYFTARMRSMKKYKIATLHKLRNPKTGQWTDPW